MLALEMSGVTSEKKNAQVILSTNASVRPGHKSKTIVFKNTCRYSIDHLKDNVPNLSHIIK